MNELNFDIISLNTRGLGNYVKQKKIVNYVKKQVSRRGIILLQQTQCTKGRKSMDQSIWMRKGVSNILTW